MDEALRTENGKRDTRKTRGARHPRRRAAAAFVAFAVGAAVLGGGTNAARAQTAVWTGAAHNGNWNDAANWRPLTVPPSGAATVLTFDAPNVSNLITATQNAASPFAFSALRFGAGSGPYRLDGSGLAVGAAGAELRNDGLGPISFGTTFNLAGTLRLTGDGAGAFSLQEKISGTGGLLLEMAGALSDGRGAVASLGIGHDFSGGVTIGQSKTGAGGVLSLSGNTSLGAGTLTVNSDANALAVGGLTLANNVAVNATAINFIGGSTGTLTGTVSGPGGLRVGNPGRTIYEDRFGQGPRLTLSGAATYTGATEVRGGVLQIGGSLSGTSSVIIGPGGTLALIGVGDAAVGGRLSDAAPVALHSGNLYLRTPNGGAGTELIGALTVSGVSTITLDGRDNGAGTLQAASLARPDRGTLLVRGTNLGAAPADGVGAFTVTGGLGGDLVGGGGAAGSKTVSILPYAVGNNGVATAVGDVSPSIDLFDGLTGQFLTVGPVQLVTYGPNGVRPLTDAEYTAGTSFAGVNAQANFRQTGDATLAAGLTAVSSYTNDGHALTAAAGGSTLRIASGAVLLRGLDPAIGATGGPLTLDFAGRTGYIHGADASEFFFSNGIELPAQIGAAITNTGAGGLVYAGLGGNGLRLLSTANNFAQLTINGVADPNTLVSYEGFASTGYEVLPYVAYSDDRNLGAASGRVTLAGGELRYVGEGPITLSRDITLAGAGGILTSEAFGGPSSILTYTGTFSGNGGLTLRGTYGITVTKRQEIFGTADIAFATFQSGADFRGDLRSLGGTFAGTTTVAGNFDSVGGRVTGAMTVNGQVFASNERQLTNAVGGALTITGNGSLDASARGVLVRNQNLDLAAGDSDRSFLILEYTAPADRLSAATNVSLDAGELRLSNSGAGGAVTEGMGGLTVGRRGGYVTFGPGFSGNPGGGATTLNLSGYESAGVTVFRGANLGTTERVFIAGRGDAFLAYALTDSNLLLRGAVPAFHSAADGVRAATLADYAASPALLQTDIAGGATRNDAHLRINGAVSAAGARNAVGSLGMADGASLTLAAGADLNFTKGGVFTPSGAATITGGTLRSGNMPLQVTGGGALTVASAAQGTALYKGGAGSVTFSGGDTHFGLVNIEQGTVTLANAGRVNAWGALRSTQPITTEDGQVLVPLMNLNLAGTGVNLRLTGLSTAGYQSSFLGVIGGTGSLTVTGGTHIFYRLNSYTGATRVEGGSLTLAGGGLSSASAVTVTGGTLTTQSLTNVGSVTVRNAGTFIHGGNATGALRVEAGGTAVVTGSVAGGTTVTGGQLTGSGNVGDLTLSGGLVGPGGVGAGAFSTLTADDLFWNGGVLDFGLSYSSAASDRLALTGVFTRGAGSDFLFRFTFDNPTAPLPTGERAYTLISGFTGTNFSASQFGVDPAGQALPGVFRFDGNNLMFVLNGSATGAVPEPSALALFAPGAAALGLWRASRRKGNTQARSTG